MGRGNGDQGSPTLFKSEVDAEASGIFPDWYSSLPSDVRYILTSNVAVRASAEATFEYPIFVSYSH